MSAPWAPSSLDAGWLAEQLRASRLTVLCGDAGTAMTQLLLGGVMPRFQRRAEDRRTRSPARAGNVLDFPDRRDALRTRAEVCVYFADWSNEPRQALTRALREAIVARGADPEAGSDLPLCLADKLRALARGSDVRFLIVLDRFEACLSAEPERGDLQALCREVLAAINEPDVPAQFLLTLHEEGAPLLERLRGHVIGFDAVRQPLPTGVGAAPGLPAEGFAWAAAAPVATRAPRTAAVYTSIENWLEKAARRGAVEREAALSAKAGPACAANVEPSGEAGAGTVFGPVSAEVPAAVSVPVPLPGFELASMDKPQAASAEAPAAAFGLMPTLTPTPTPTTRPVFDPASVPEPAPTSQPEPAAQFDPTPAPVVPTSVDVTTASPLPAWHTPASSAPAHDIELEDDAVSVHTLSRDDARPGSEPPLAEASIASRVAQYPTAAEPSVSLPAGPVPDAQANAHAEAAADPHDDAQTQTPGALPHHDAAVDIELPPAASVLTGADPIVLAAEPAGPSWHDLAPSPVGAETDAESGDDAAAGPDREPSMAPPTHRARTGRSGSRRPGPMVWMVGGLALLVGIGLATRLDDGRQPTGGSAAAETVAATPPSPATAQPRPDASPTQPIAVSGGDLLAARMSEDLARALAPLGSTGMGSTGLRTPGSGGWLADLSRLQGGTQLAIVRYDALQAARDDRRAGPLRIVMPLVTQELAFVVRADSPLRYIHEIDGQRINIGPADGPRALTVRTAYRSLFGQTLPMARASLADEAAALEELLHRSTDVVVLVGNAPAPWASAWPEIAGGLRLLSLAPDHPSSRRALRGLLTASLDPGPGAGPEAVVTPTLAVMSFLVTGAAEPLQPGAANAAAASPSALGRIAAALCQQLPGLQRDGHPKWREVHPDLQLEVGWPYAPEAQRALRGCGAIERAPITKSGATRSATTAHLPPPSGDSAS